MNSPLLSEADLSRLQSIHQHLSPPPRATHEQRLALEALLEGATTAIDPAALEKHVGFGDEVVLVSPTDPTDDFLLRIVMPHEAEPAEGRISVLAPVSLAILGQSQGHVTSWNANGFTREMRITGILKNPATGMVTLSP